MEWVKQKMKHQATYGMASRKRDETMEMTQEGHFPRTFIFSLKVGQAIPWDINMGLNSQNLSCCSSYEAL